MAVGTCRVQPGLECAAARKSVQISMYVYLCACMCVCVFCPMQPLVEAALQNRGTVCASLSLACGSYIGFTAAHSGGNPNVLVDLAVQVRHTHTHTRTHTHAHTHTRTQI